VAASTCFQKGREVDRQGRRKRKRVEGAGDDAMTMMVTVTKIEKQYESVPQTAVDDVITKSSAHSDFTTSLFSQLSETNLFHSKYTLI
jgi:hypothetical protein